MDIQSLRNMDSALSRYRELVQAPTFKNLRKALGMSGAVIARKLGITVVAVYRLEKRLEDKSISLKKLEQLVDAIGCDLRVVIVPRTGLVSQLQEQAKKAAKAQYLGVEHTMKLEEQNVSDETLMQQIDDLASEFIANKNKSIWEYK